MNKKKDIHPKRQHIHAHETLGDKVADTVVGGMGSWKFIIIQTAIVTVWIVLNIWLLTHPFDPYPLILLNLVFSTQAAYASPLILMSQNRQSEKDRKRDDTEAQEVSLLMSINQQQLDLLHLLRDQKGIEYISEKIEHQEQVSGEVLTKLSAVLEKKPRARARRQEAISYDATTHQS